MDVLARACIQLRQDPDALVDGVAMRELVEGAVSALHQLGNDPQSAGFMLRDHPFIDMLIKVSHGFLGNSNFLCILLSFFSGYRANAVEFFRKIDFTRL